MNFKRILSLVLAVVMIAAMLAACAPAQNNTKPSNSNTNNSSSDTQSEKATYRVTIVDVDGKPATSGVVVKFMQNGEQVGMELINGTGMAAKELEKGDYTVELMFTNQDIQYYYDESELTLSKTKTELTVNLYMKLGDTPETFYDGEYSAYPITTGNTYVTLKPGRNYFLYTPEMAGEYELFTTNFTYRVGSYGSIYFVQENDNNYNADINGTHMSLSPGMISPEGKLVIGVDNPGTEDVNTVLHLVRKSDYIDTSVPGREYTTTHSLQSWTLPAGSRVNKFDITANTSYELVLDDQGFYHLNDANGPLVVVFLGEKAGGHLTYLAPYDTILKSTRVIAYFKNDDGTYSHYENYSACLQDYIGVFSETDSTYSGGCIDRESGLYPLTEDLKYIIQQNGAYSGWWDATGESYIFGETTVNEENAWLFMCGYLD